MKKAENSRIVKANINEIREIIINPKLYNIRGYKHYEHLNENEWIEDHGNNIIYQLKFVSINKLEIIIEQQEIGKSNRVYQQYIYKFEEIDSNNSTITILINYLKANILTRSIKKINDCNPALQTYSYQLKKIAAFLKQYKKSLKNN